MFSKIYLLLLAIFAGSFAHAEDVIYKKDGSVLKGTIIEQNFRSGKFKIQLLGGSIFVIDENDIDKITKEESTSTAKSTESELNQVAKESRARLTDNSVNTLATQRFNNQAALVEQPSPYNPIKSTVYIGSLSHRVSLEFDRYVYNGFSTELKKLEQTAYFSGFKLGFQQVHTKHIASHYTLNIGSLDSIEITDEDDYIIESYSGSDLADEDYLGLSASVIASTNLQKGWQFFTGLGLLHDEYSNEFEDYTFTSLGLELGMGYAWEKAQLSLQYQGVMAGDYDSDLTVSNIHLQLGINL